MMGQGQGTSVLMGTYTCACKIINIKRVWRTCKNDRQYEQGIIGKWFRLVWFGNVRDKGIGNVLMRLNPP